MTWYSGVNRFVLPAAIAVAVACPAAFAQSDYQLWLTPKLNEFEFLGELETIYYEDADVEARSDDVGMTDYRLRLRVPFRRSDTAEWLGSTDLEIVDLRGTPRLRRRFDDLPGTLYDASAGLTYRRVVEGEYLAGGNLTIGSASDELFHSIDETYAKGTAWYARPHLEYTNWLFYLNFDTFRELPVLPGVGYQFPLGKRVMGVVGIPIVGFGGSFSDAINAEMYYVPIHNLHAKLSYKPMERLTTSVGFDWESRYFKRVDREDSKDRLELEQKLIKAGIAYTFTESMSLELNGGYAFDRLFAEGEDRDERSDHELELDDSWFGGLSFSVEF